MSRRPSKLGTAIVVATGIGTGIVASELDYPLWAVPLVSLLGAFGAAVAVAMVR